MAFKRQNFSETGENTEILIRDLGDGLRFEIVGSYVVDFTFLLALFSPSLSRRIGAVLLPWFSKMRETSVLTYITCFKNFLKFASQSGSYSEQLSVGSTNLTIGPATVWCEVLHSWAADGWTRERKEATSARLITLLNRIIIRIMDAGVSPVVELPSVPDRWRSRETHRKGKLVSESDVERHLLDLVKKADVSLKANPWGYCACKAVPSNLRRAACQQSDCHTGRVGIDGRPDYTGSDEVRCAGCLFFFTDETRRDHWENTERSLDDALERPINLAPLLRSREKIK